MLGLFRGALMAFGWPLGKLHSWMLDRLFGGAARTNPQHGWNAFLYGVIGALFVGFALYGARTNH